MATEKNIGKRATQGDAVYTAMHDIGGYATFNQLNHAALRVSGVAWATKTPFATIRRIVQEDKRFFKLRPGLWALTEEKDRIAAELQLSPSQPASTAGESFDHGYYQGLLVELGNFKNFETFVPYQDKNRRFLQQKLADVTTVDTFHEFTYSHVLRRAVTVDVTWFNERQFPHAFYEVEHSTDIYNSLLKFVELQDFNTRFYIVADKAREAEYEDRCRQQAFGPIKGRVKFLSYEELAAMHTGAAAYAAIDRLT